MQGLKAAPQEPGDGFTPDETLLGLITFWFLCAPGLFRVIVGALGVSHGEKHFSSPAVARLPEVSHPTVQCSELSKTAKGCFWGWV